jgi:pimeloyl-ACP methyl ester carboxylesterase
MPVLDNGSFAAELNGFEIHYEVHGRGPVVMGVPNSWGLSLGGLRGLFRGLEGDLTMVYFDPRGMGGSGRVREDADMGMAAVAPTSTRCAVTSAWIA